MVVVLPAPSQPKESENLTALNLEVETIDSDEPAVALGQSINRPRGRRRDEFDARRN